jgi:transcriptional regulator GlxA family with amidase domain
MASRFRGSGQCRSGLLPGQLVEEFAKTAPHRIGVLIYPGASAYDLASAAEVFSTANGQARRQYGIAHDLYTVDVISSVSGPVTMELGLRTLADRTVADPIVPYDTVLISGGCAEPLDSALADKRLMAWLRNVAVETRRIASMCTGAFLLAEAGVLEGPVTTHWAHCATLQARYPRLQVQPDHIFVKHGRTYSSAGSTAAMDLALALVEEDLGRPIAMEIARRLVMFLRRPGGQSQFSGALLAQTAQPKSLNGVPEWILENLAEDLSVEALAERAHMSPRNFARVFVAETGLTPGKFVERARVERARMMIEDTGLPLLTIAGHAGFDGDRQMRRAFLRWLKVTPSDYASRFRIATAAFSENVRRAAKPIDLAARRSAA